MIDSDVYTNKQLVSMEIFRDSRYDVVEMTIKDTLRDLERKGLVPRDGLRVEVYAFKDMTAFMAWLADYRRDNYRTRHPHEYAIREAISYHTALIIVTSPRTEQLYVNVETYP